MFKTSWSLLEVLLGSRGEEQQQQHGMQRLKTACSNISLATNS